MNFTPPFLSTIKARTFIVHGDRDDHFSVPIPVELYRCIPHSCLWIVPNSGHVPFFDFPAKPRLDDEKTLFTKKTLEFLRNEWEKNNPLR
jgi:pimeloyl-ACP methyl ester carboxylesterase